MARMACSPVNSHFKSFRDSYQLNHQNISFERQFALSSGFCFYTFKNEDKLIAIKLLVRIK